MYPLLTQWLFLFSVSHLNLNAVQKSNHTKARPEALTQQHSPQLRLPKRCGLACLKAFHRRPSSLEMVLPLKPAATTFARSDEQNLL